MRASVRWHLVLLLGLLAGFGTTGRLAAQDGVESGEAAEGDAGAEQPGDTSGTAADEGASPSGEATDGDTAGPSTTSVGTSDAGGSSGGSAGPSSGADTSPSGAAASGTAGTTTGPTTTAGTTTAGTTTGGATMGSADDRDSAPRAGEGAQPLRVDDEEEDEGDPYDFLWVELFGGVSYVDLRAISTENYYPESVRLTGTGPAGGVAAGFRIEFLSVGLRGALAHYGDGFEVGTAVAEVKLHIPIPIFRPFIRAGFGLGWHGDSDAESLMIPDTVQTTVFGWAFNAAAGFDVYLAHWFAIGAAFNLDVLNMSRQAWEEEPAMPDTVRFEESGDAVGLQARGQIAVSFHL